MNELPQTLRANPRLSQWVRLDEPGVVTVTPGKVELGQGIVSALAQIVADELDVELTRVRMVPAAAPTGPNEGYTAGSFSIQHSGQALRQVCAEIRAILLAEAARHLTPSDDSGDRGWTVRDGTVEAAGGGAGVTYWELVKPGLLDRDATGEAQPKAPADRRLIGTPVPRIDLPAKVSGGAAYISDHAPPDLLHARVVRPPGPGAVLAELDETTVRAMPEVTAVVRDGGFLGVLAEREEQALIAADRLRAAARWEKGAELPDEDDLPAYLRSAPAQTRLVEEQGRPADGTVRTLTAAYTRPYLAHASIGPACAIALWQDDTLQVWGSTQGIYPHRAELARVLGLDPDRVTVRHLDGPGCYGHNGADDVMFEAALLARAAPGRPVRLQWSRADELAWSPFGSAALVELEADLDADGRITHWRHEHWSNGYMGRPGFAGAGSSAFVSASVLAEPYQPWVAVDREPLAVGGSGRNSVPYYDVPRRIVGNTLLESPLRTSSLRSLGAHPNVFAIESFMDELAEAAGADPVEFRLRHLTDPRARAVLEAAAEHAGWRGGDPDQARGQGIAFARYKNMSGYCAVVADVAAVHEVRVERLVVAADLGMVVNPDGARNQLEGGAVQAASWTLKERVRFDRAGVTSTTWESYPILRFSEVPDVEVVLTDRPDEPPLGAGEVATGPTSAAIANALGHALGVRVRDLPLTPEHIAAAL
ncbi:MAG: molybdopterin-dependent oxidoreductase [Streptosporangiales bacterium]|nr:molybdopterin-dependent oxidoreductase [Streptosporangiales bacterium]